MTTITLSETALERLNDRYGHWRMQRCDHDVMDALEELVELREERDAALALAEQRAGVETAARAMIEHYDACEECQDQGSCADAYDLWMAVKDALAAPMDGAAPPRRDEGGQ